MPESIPDNGGFAALAADFTEAFYLSGPGLLGHRNNVVTVPLRVTRLVRDEPGDQHPDLQSIAQVRVPGTIVRSPLSVSSRGSLDNLLLVYFVLSILLAETGRIEQ